MRRATPPTSSPPRRLGPARVARPALAGATGRALGSFPTRLDPRVYLATGEQHSSRLFEVLDRHGVDLGAQPTVLDFGCGYGRVLRWMLPWGRAGRGCPGGRPRCGERIAEWARRCLGALVPTSSRSTSQPHSSRSRTQPSTWCTLPRCLPHIADGAEAWMLEACGGSLGPAATSTSRSTTNAPAELVRTGQASPSLAGSLAAADQVDGRLGDTVDVVALSRRAGRAQVFRSRAWVERVWGAWFDLVSFEPEAHHAQTGGAAPKAARTRPIRLTTGRRRW